METREILLKQLNETISQLFGVYQNMAYPEIAIYEDWTAKDILGHITFWHESFARNVSDIVNDIKPTPLKGKYSDLNQRCLDEMRTHTIEDIIKRLKVAHRIIQENILNAKLALIPYKKGSRDYSPEEHLDIVNKHIKEHLKGIKEASKDIYQFTST
ncbi:MAG: ClbS/DfsB family four-helix bundle protein [Aquificales bacterium]|nr:ClbS/DfsB family four-helix bundle protein [Aquificales bacterium]